MRKQRDLSGNRYGKLIVICPNGKDKDGAHYVSTVRCDCGMVFDVRDTFLVNGDAIMCKRCVPTIHRTHGKTKERVFNVWQKMMARCYNKNDKSYAAYGGRGIKVCDEWHNSVAFIEWAYKNGYDKNKNGIDNSIDRKNVDGNYEPTNCRWVELKTQARNKRVTRYANYNGQQMPIRDIADIVGIKATNIIQRIDKYGWSEYDAIHIPEGGKHEKP